MAKKKQTEEKGMNMDFYTLYKNSPKEIQMLLDRLGISSFEDLAGLATIMGIDLDKLQNYTDKNGQDAFPSSIKEVMIDNYKPSDKLLDGLKDIVFGGEDDSEEDGYMDEDEAFSDDDEDGFCSYCLPQNPFIGDNAQEYHIRIKLNNAPVPIWRELKLPSNLSLETLSFIINEAMGWDGTHLHHFIHGNVFYKDTEELEELKQMAFFSTDSMNQDTNKFAISHLLREKSDRIKYEYDYGDGWMHDVWLKGIREYEPDEEPTLTLVKGKGACPPEDCGGVWGYANLLELSQKKRKSAEEKELLNWNGIDKSFDPNDFDKEYTEALIEELWIGITEE